MFIKELFIETVLREKVHQVVKNKQTEYLHD